jgi:hypothetical protein
VGSELFLRESCRYQRAEYELVQLEVVLQFAIEGLFCGEPGEVVIALKKLILAFLDRIRETPGSPAFLVNNVSFAGGDKSFDPFPGLCGFVRADHRAQDDYKFEMTQRFP